jgi:hypothetical protein
VLADEYDPDICWHTLSFHREEHNAQMARDAWRLRVGSLLALAILSASGSTALASSYVGNHLPWLAPICMWIGVVLLTAMLMLGQRFQWRRTLVAGGMHAFLHLCTIATIAATLLGDTHWTWLAEAAAGGAGGAAGSAGGGRWKVTSDVVPHIQESRQRFVLVVSFMFPLCFAVFLPLSPLGQWIGIFAQLTLYPAMLFLVEVTTRLSKSEVGGSLGSLGSLDINEMLPIILMTAVFALPILAIVLTIYATRLAGFQAILRQQKLARTHALIIRRAEEEYSSATSSSAAGRGGGGGGGGVEGGEGGRRKLVLRSSSVEEEGEKDRDEHDTHRDEVVYATGSAASQSLCGKITSELTRVSVLAKFCGTGWLFTLFFVLGGTLGGFVWPLGSSLCLNAVLAEAAKVRSVGEAAAGAAATAAAGNGGDGGKGAGKVPTVLGMNTNAGVAMTIFWGSGEGGGVFDSVFGGVDFEAFGALLFVVVIIMAVVISRCQAAVLDMAEEGGERAAKRVAKVGGGGRWEFRGSDGGDYRFDDADNSYYEGGGDGGAGHNRRGSGGGEGGEGGNVAAMRTTQGEPSHSFEDSDVGDAVDESTEVEEWSEADSDGRADSACDSASHSDSDFLDGGGSEGQGDGEAGEEGGGTGNGDELRGEEYRLGLALQSMRDMVALNGQAEQVVASQLNHLQGEVQFLSEQVNVFPPH